MVGGKGMEASKFPERRVSRFHKVAPFWRWLGLSAAGALLLALAVPVTEASAATSSQTVTVPATQPWTDTGISLPAGTVSFTASGTININGGDPGYDETP